LFAAFMLVHPWIRMITHGGKGSLFSVLFMRIRGNPVSLIIDAYVTLLQSGDKVSLRDVESHYVANQAKIMMASDLVASIRDDSQKPNVC